MLDVDLPEPSGRLLTTLSSFLDRRHAGLLRPLFLGLLLAGGRRTATAWFRAGGIPEEFRRAYTLLGTPGKGKARTFAALLFRCLRQGIDPGAHWLFGLDDTPTPRYGAEVAGAGLHHNPTPGPAQQRWRYGHLGVTCAWVVRHPDWHTLALPLLADLYRRQQDVARSHADRRPAFATKLALAAAQIAWLAPLLADTDRPLGFARDGAYAKRPVLKAAREQGGVVVSRLRRDAALYDLPPETPRGQRPRGRPRIYGKQRLSLAKRAGHRQGWQEVECFQYQQEVTKTVKSFLATWRPAGGVIRVVLAKEEHGWLAYFGTDPEASVQDILEAAAGRTAIEQTLKEVKESEGAGQQQLRYGRANVGAFHGCLGGYTAVEWWAWDKPFARLCDRSDSPWDTEERRPAHQDRRQALQRELSAEEFWRRWGERPGPAEIREVVEVLLGMAV